MNIRRTLLVVSCLSMLAFAGACGDDETDPTLPEDPTPAVSVSVSPSTSVSPSVRVSVSPSVSVSASPDSDLDPSIKDSGLVRCEKIQADIEDSKLPLSLKNTDAQFADIRKDFSDSKYDDVRKAGEKFVDEYKGAVKAAGSGGTPDAATLTDSATTLIAACSKHM